MTPLLNPLLVGCAQAGASPIHPSRPNAAGHEMTTDRGLIGGNKKPSGYGGKILNLCHILR
jgi:hypothetical protein